MVGPSFVFVHNAKCICLNFKRRAGIFKLSPCTWAQCGWSQFCNCHISKVQLWHFKTVSMQLSSTWFLPVLAASAHAIPIILSSLWIYCMPSQFFGCRSKIARKVIFEAKWPSGWVVWVSRLCGKFYFRGNLLVVMVISIPSKVSFYRLPSWGWW